MRAYLLDTNVLVALFWPPHAQHDQAVKWFARTGRGSLSNVAREPLMLAAGMLLLFTAHLAFDGHRLIWGRLLVTASLILAVSVAFLTPVLPE